MRLVAKHDKNQIPAVLRTLSRSETDLLQKYWATDDETHSPQELAAVGSLLSDAHRRNAWFACDCNNQPTYLAPVEYRHGKFKLTRLAQRGAHSDNCPFHWEEGELGQRSTSDGDGRSRPSKIPKTMDFMLYQSEKDQAAERQESNSRISKPTQARPSDALQRRLFWLLDKAGLNVFDGSSLARKDRMDKLIAVLKETSICENIKLSEVTWWTLKAVKDQWIKSRFTALRSKWPKDCRPQGFLILVIDQIDIEKRTLKDRYGGKITIEGPLRFFGRDTGNSGPYLAIISVTEEAGEIVVPRAYVHQIRLDYQKDRESERYTDYFIIDSGYEREAATTLWHIVKRINKDEPGRLRIVKPLGDFDVDGEGCRPDFLVEDTHRGQTAVIETMGTMELEYRERKLRTHANMATLGELILDERPGVDKNVANERLTNAVCRWLKAK